LVRSLVRATHVWLVLLSALMGGVDGSESGASPSG
jgi:hypothetical protein